MTDTNLNIPINYDVSAYVQSQYSNYPLVNEPLVVDQNGYINIRAADGNDGTGVPGIVTNVDQAFNGVKTFNDGACVPHMAVPSATSVVNYTDLQTLVHTNVIYVEPCLDFYDFTSPPVSPSNGDRYISSSTVGAFVINMIYEYDSSSSSWVETNVSDGYATFVESMDALYCFDGSSWIKISSFNGTITTTTESISTTSGALIVAGGAGIAKSLFIGGTINATDTTEATSTNSGSVLISGGAGIAKSLFVGSDITFNGNLYSANFIYVDNPTNLTITKPSSQGTNSSAVVTINSDPGGVHGFGNHLALKGNPAGGATIFRDDGGLNNSALQIYGGDSSGTNSGQIYINGNNSVSDTGCGGCVQVVTGYDNINHHGSDFEVLGQQPAYNNLFTVTDNGTTGIVNIPSLTASQVVVTDASQNLTTTMTPTFTGIYLGTSDIMSSISTDITFTSPSNNQISTSTAIKTYIANQINNKIAATVINFYDNSNGLPSSPSVGDTYIAMYTANNWTVNRICTYSSLGWLDFAPYDGQLAYTTQTNMTYQYSANASSWNTIHFNDATVGVSSLGSNIYKFSFNTMSTNTSTFRSLTYSPTLNMIICASLDSPIYYTSSDSINWTFQNNGQSANFYLVKWVDAWNLFVGAGTNGIYTSQDGLNWTQSDPTTSPWWTSCYNDDTGTFVIISLFNGTGMISGTKSGSVITWTLSSAVDTIAHRGYVIYIHKYLLYYLATSVGVYSSPNLVTWTITAATGSYSSLCYSPDLDRIVACGNNGASWKYSDDGSIWNTCSIPSGNTGQWQDIIWVPDAHYFVASGDYDYNTTSMLMYSYSGDAWSQDTTITGIAGTAFNSLIYNPTSRRLTTAYQLYGESNCTASSLSIGSSTNSISPDTGALKVKGGLGVSEDVHIGGTLNVSSLTLQNFDSGIVNVTGTDDSSSITAGSLIVSGGVGIAKNAYIGGTLSVLSINIASINLQTLDSNIVNINGTDDSSSITSGSLIVSGGAGIAKNAYIGGLNIGNGAQTITSISTDSALGGGSSSNSVLATQLAIKTAISNSSYSSTPFTGWAIGGAFLTGGLTLSGKLIKLGSLVHICFDDCLSSCTGGYGTALNLVPAGFRPASQTIVSVLTKDNDATTQWGSFIVDNSGNVSIYKDLNSGNFTANGGALSTGILACVGNYIATN